MIRPGEQERSGEDIGDGDGEVGKAQRSQSIVAPHASHVTITLALGQPVHLDPLAFDTRDPVFGVPAVA